MNIRTLNYLKIANANTIVKGFSNSNPQIFSNIFLQYLSLGRSASKFIFHLNWPSFIINLTFNIKIYEVDLCHSHGNYKLDL